jgi:nitroreductase
VDALDAIRSRRMIPRVSEEMPSRTDIEELIELAVRAPNHHRSEPWRFHVLAGSERMRLARAIEQEAIEGGADADRAARDARAKVERAPVIVVFTCVPSDDPKVFEAEELASVAMAMENFLLGAYAKGLGAMLRTGTTAYHPAIVKTLELAPNEKVVGFVYLGIPAGERDMTPRTPAGERTRWLGFE